MRLSQVSGERVFDVVADIIAPCVNIVTSDDMKGLMEFRDLPSEQRVAALSRSVKEHLPSLIRKHKADVITILASIEGVPEDEYLDGMTLPKLVADLTELLTDEVFGDFLAAAATSKG